VRTKTLFSAVLVISLLSLQNCALFQPSSDAFFRADARLSGAEFTVKSVSVLVNHVSDKEIETQIGEYAALKMNAESSPGHETYDVEIVVVERAFLEGINMKNSVQTSVKLSRAGVVAATLSCFETGRASIVSAKTQRRVVEKLCAMLAKRQKAERKALDAGRKKTGGDGKT
jgi:hypothetical protein